ncbi:Threonine/homoserine/homoserine lactone efflux protein [Collimonas sp. OK242]|jgi:threonine/homoserine/homoserine lactone efflux protein|uniref:LysE family translocator n=1 Tax=Collimonas sp. OK242 TaxID=1798195 RepID=UPI00089D706F|nr:LysE family translocator [Collimonas sp. OK242]SDY49570.1 Threonine/homoserine/homoserine lactone efflux protein [Collimonas sp. OK242]
MHQSVNLWLYFMIVFGVIVLPGLDMAFVLASALVGGRRSGLAAVAGIVAGGVCHMTMGALGLAVVLKLWPSLFNLVLLAGAAYIAWIGCSLLRSESGFHFAPTSEQALAKAPATTFYQGMLTSLLNPKAYVFMLAIFPQFLKIDAGPIWSQALVLWIITALTQVGVYGIIAILSSRTRSWFDTNPRGSLIAARVVGGLLIAAGIFTGIEGWQAI